MVFDPSTNGNISRHGDVQDDQPGGKYGYRLGHRLGEYQIPDVVLNSPNQKIKVITIGAGISGILMSYLIQKHGENIQHVVYEKNGDIGGTWLENRYPGCACDVPSHAYAFAFALYPDWPKYLSPSEDIFRYLDRVVECFGLRKQMVFNSTVISCDWNEDESQWHIRIKNSETGEIREDVANIVIGANGILNSWKFPEEVDGLHSFKGRLIHTARWPTDFGEEQWKGRRVAVIGSGATSMQVVPTMQPHVEKMDIFVRTPVWFAEFADHSGDNFDYTTSERESMKSDTKALVHKAKFIEDKLNTAAGLRAFMVHSAEARMIREHFTDRMRKFIHRDDIFEQLLPNFAVGCRRLTPGNPYMRAVQKENVQLHRGAVTKVTPSTIIASNGDEVEVDTIICATGFDVSFRPPFSVVGRNGISLQEKWERVPEGYLSVGVPDIPNYFTVVGPSFPIANGSVMGPLQAVGRYILKAIQKMQRENIASMVAKQSVTDQFNEHAQAWMVGTAWADSGCRSWYKDNNTGRVNAIWPGSSLHFCELIAEPRYEDFEIKYSNKHNMWEFLGLGFTKNMMAENGDLSPYMALDAIDAGFVGYEPDKDAEDARVRRMADMVHDGPKKKGNGEGATVERMPSSNGSI
ncbi:FAD-binding monooxygenase moxY [Colletotrichum siamense]|nr:FAD-binding monooxygenase moxY [Colletotrichum siamense]